LAAEESVEVAGAQVEVEAAVPVAAAEGAVDLAVAAVAVAKERFVNTREGPYRRPFAEAR
jgi:hypothetical protein